MLEPTNVPNHLPPLTEEADADDEHDDVITEGRDETENNGSQDLVQPEVETTISQAASFTPYTAATLPYMSNDEYQKLVSAIAKILAGEETIQDWMTKDFAQHQVRFCGYFEFGIRLLNTVTHNKYTCSWPTTFHTKLQ